MCMCVLIQEQSGSGCSKTLVYSIGPCVCSVNILAMVFTIEIHCIGEK